MKTGDDLAFLAQQSGIRDLWSGRIGLDNKSAPGPAALTAGLVPGPRRTGLEFD